jgi:hypothetical protein
MVVRAVKAAQATQAISWILGMEAMGQEMRGQVQAPRVPHARVLVLAHTPGQAQTGAGVPLLLGITMQRSVERSIECRRLLYLPRDYTYEELLERVFGILRERNPEVRVRHV